MFGALTEKLKNLFSGFSNTKKLTEENISEAVGQVRLALLDADVNFAVVDRFIQRVKSQAIGDIAIQSVTSGQQFIALIHSELVQLMGGVEVPLDLQGKVSVVMLCGLQGSGKTTTSAKLAVYIGKTEKQKKILLVACDLQRPAAVEQLKKLGSDIGVEVFSVDGEKDPLKVAKQAQEKARVNGFDVLIVDTAGRLHLDEELMKELAEMKALLTPREILFVANAAMGQDAVRTATQFDQRLQMTGTILTMLDGSARAGAAISIREVTNKPLKFEGTGERPDDLQLFHPRSMADRILGMGDVINLVKKAKEHFDKEESQKLEQKALKGSFTYNDYLKQMGALKKMGSLKSLIKMLPGAGSIGDMELSDREFNQMEAMILSMTPAERNEKDELIHPRRKRIAQGSGTELEAVNRMVKNFKRMKQIVKSMPDMKNKMKGGLNMEEFKDQMKGNKWL